MCRFCADSSGPRAVEVAPDSCNASHATTDQTCTYLSSFLTVQIASLRNSSEALPAASCATHSHHRNAQVSGDGLLASASQPRATPSPRRTCHHAPTKAPRWPAPAHHGPARRPPRSPHRRRRKTGPCHARMATPPFQRRPPHQRCNRAS